MKEFIVLAVLFLCLTFVPVKTISLVAFLLAIFETLFLLCLKYRPWKFLFCFFGLSLFFKWAFDVYIEFFYQYIFPNFDTFGLKYKLFYFFYIVLFEAIVVCSEILLFKKMVGYDKKLWILLGGMSLFSLALELLFGPLYDLIG